MRARVVLPWSIMYPDPIVVSRGEIVAVGRDDPEWPGWRWCTDDRGREGWVPERLLDGDGRMKCDYSARELAVAPGDEVDVEEELCGWLLCVRGEERGWIPKTHAALLCDSR